MQMANSRKNVIAQLGQKFDVNNHVLKPNPSTTPIPLQYYTEPPPVLHRATSSTTHVPQVHNMSARVDAVLIHTRTMTCQQVWVRC